MKSWWDIFKSELSLIFEDKSILLTCLVAPLLYAFFVGSIYSEKEVNEIPIAVVDYDHSSLSRKVASLINSTEKVKLKGHFSNLEDALFYFNNLEVQGIVVLPKGFQKKTMNLEGAKIDLILNNTKFLTSNEINKSVQKVVLMVSGGVRMRYFVSNKIPIDMAKEKAQPILPVIKSIYNATNNYGDYLLPILLILILQQTLIIAFGQSVVHEFQHGILKDLNGISFLEFTKILSAKSAYYLFLYSAYFFVFYKLIFPHYTLVFNGSIGFHLLLGFLFITVILLYTILVASYFRTAIGWTEIMAFSTYPLFLVSGYSWPVESMPELLQWVANILPSTPYFNVFNSLSVEKAHLPDITSGFIHLLILLVLAYVLLYLRFSLSKNLISKGQVS
ncbi:ABC transporter permease [Tamlana agarivorans]|uniref:ABC transporter permease n=1 Tax=Pseudotamlana agarivorans TaxID=481183 RepID=A0ACC5U660_9FLAO|nr:ABC transporter permease [Tamlana agarivorans]MBU2949771.1 ABC transporter permease [Tamlana agarivorans]